MSFRNDWHKHFVCSRSSLWLTAPWAACLCLCHCWPLSSQLWPSWELHQRCTPLGLSTGSWDAPTSWACSSQLMCSYQSSTDCGCPAPMRYTQHAHMVWHDCTIDHWMNLWPVNVFSLSFFNYNVLFPLCTHFSFLHSANTCPASPSFVCLKYDLRAYLSSYLLILDVLMFNRKVTSRLSGVHLLLHLFHEPQWPNCVLWANNELTSIMWI